MSKKIFQALLFSVSLLLFETASSQSTFLPTDLSGLTVWMRADSNCMIFNTYPVVQQWNDSSGIGNHAIQNNASQQPAFVPNIVSLNNHNVLHFDSIDDVLDIADNLSIDFTDRMTIFIIAKQDAATPNKTLLGKWDYGVSGSWVLQTWPTTELAMFIVKDIADVTNGANIDITSNANGTTQYTAISAEYNVTTDTVDPVEFRKNFTVVSSIPNGSFTQSMLNSTVPLRIGSFGGLGRYYNGDIAEIIIYNDTLSAADRDSVEQYLHFKYAPPVNLGSDISSSDFCPDTLDAGARFVSFLWSTGDTTQTIVVNNSGTYYVTVTDIFGFASTDTIDVSFPSFNEPLPNTILCLGDSFPWNTNLSNAFYTFLWSTNQTDSVIYISNAGQYWVTATDLNGCSKTSDTINVIIVNYNDSASIGPASDSLCAGNILQLVSGAAQAQTYLWTPPPNSSLPVSSLPNFPVDSTGWYFLDVTDTNGCLARDSIYITITGVAPVASFTFTGACENDPTNFTDTSTPQDSINTWLWYFGEPSSGSADTSISPNPAHLYADTGTYVVTLRVTSYSGCYQDYTNTVRIYPKPIPNFSVLSTSCSGVPIVFTNSTDSLGYNIQSWAWNFGDPGSGGNNISSLKNPSHTFSTPGNYNVTVTATNIHGCDSTISLSVIVNASATTYFVPRPNCFGEPMVFDNFTTGYQTIYWDFGDASGSSATANQIFHLYANPGNYTVTVSCITAQGCISSYTSQVTVNPLPHANFLTTPACVNTLYSFTDSSWVNPGAVNRWKWTLPDGSTDTTNSPDYIFTDSLIYPVKLLAISQSGCKDSITRSIKVYPQPVASFGSSPPYGDAPLEEFFGNTSTGAISYLWDFGDTTPTSSDINPVHTYYNLGNYTVTLIATSSRGCMDTAVKYVYVIKPILDLGVVAVNKTNGANYISVSATVRNFGNLEISNFKIAATLENRLPVFEYWNGSLLPTNGIDYNFTANFEISNNNPPTYLCVEATYPNNVWDDNPANNILCINLSEDFVIVDPFPNPSTDLINLLIIAPHKDRLAIDVFDAGGKLIRNVYNGTVVTGLNKFTFDSSSLSEGVYFCRFSFLTKTFVRPLTHISKNN